MSGNSTIPAVPRTPETDAFWDAASDGRLLYGACRGCARRHYYPRRVCPWCFSADVVWETAAGTGVIHTFSIVRRTVPAYVPAYVTLAEGVTLLTNIVSCDPDRVAIGDMVELVFLPAADGQLVPFFCPAATVAARA